MPSSSSLKKQLNDLFQRSLRNNYPRDKRQLIKIRGNKGRDFLCRAIKSTGRRGFDFEIVRAASIK